MKRRISVILTVMFLLVGCEKENRLVDPAGAPGSGISAEEENKRLRHQVEQLQAQLRDAERKRETAMSGDANAKADADEPLAERFPELADFFHPHRYRQIGIGGPENVRTVDDPAILAAVDNLIVIRRQVSLGSPPRADIEPVRYVLTTDKGAVEANVVRRGIVSFDELYPGVFFEVDNNVSQLGQAFMNKPAYLEGESVWTKMLNSGLLRIDDGGSYYVYDAGTIRDLAMAVFDAAAANEGEAIADTAPADFQATFHYYGEEIQLTFYVGKAHIQDDADSRWYDLSEEDIGQIKARLSAG